MRSFASDNNSGVHPLVMDALMKANTGHAVGYGDDPWTKEATEIVKKQFANACDALFVFNGTGSNTMALQMMTRPYHIIFCAEYSGIAANPRWARARLLLPCNLHPLPSISSHK